MIINSHYYSSCVLFLIILSKTYTPFAQIQTYATLDWNIENEGFHREIKYNLEMIDYQWAQCDILLKQIMPRNLYVNKDQLEDLRRLGKVTAIVKDFVDTELPEDVSPPHAVYLPVVFKEETDERVLKSEIILPVHVRYHSPQPGGGYRSAFINIPEMYITCTQYPLNSSLGITSMLPCLTDVSDLCEYHSLPFISDTNTVEISVPVGNTDHYNAVILATYFITLGATIYIYAVVLLSLPKSS